MPVNWNVKALEDYKFFLKDQEIIKKIQKLLASVEEKYDYGVGKPERLKGYKERFIYSRRIDEKNRLVYEVSLGSEKQVLSITILGLKGHYEDR